MAIYKEMNMTKNMGLVDRIVRIVFAVVVALLILLGQVTGIAAVILGIFAAVFLLTGAIAFCPLYLPFGISTRKKE